jgi:ABC-2 type transport system ATP-binding protein
MIRVSGLVKRYGERTVLDGVDLEVEEGDILGLLGPNGAGKTTMLRILSAQIRPDAGDVEIGRFKLPEGENAVRKAIGMVPQEQALYRRLTLRENLELMAALHGMDRQERRTRCHSLLQRLGLGEHADQVAEECSTGMRQALNILMGLAHCPDIILLDEPTVGLDPRIRRTVWELLAEEASRGKAVLLATHAMDEAERHCDKVAFLHLGKIFAQGTPAEVRGRLVEMSAGGRGGELGLEEVFMEITGGEA